MPNPLRLTAPIEKVFRLEKTDQLFSDGQAYTTVTIRQARRGATSRREDLYKQVKRQYSDTHPDQVTVLSEFSITELHRIEAFLTLVACSLEDPNGKPLFPPEVLAGKDEARFTEAWNSLPDEICNEIHEKVLEVNLSWKPLGN